MGFPPGGFTHRPPGRKITVNPFIWAVNPRGAGSVADSREASRLGGQAGSAAADASARQLTIYDATFGLPFIGQPGSPGRGFSGYARRRIAPTAPGPFSPMPGTGPGPEAPGLLGRQASGGAGHG
jgi:hypothetical protein